MRRLILAAAFLVFAALSLTPAKADDRETYRQVVERMHGGEGYYQATTVELREGNFPLRPAMAFRPPTLAWFLSWLPNTQARFALLLGLVVAAVIAWTHSFSDEARAYRLAMAALLMCGLANVGGPSSVYLHEPWAIVMMTLSLAFYRHLCPSVIFALSAVLIRETALAFVAASAVTALLHSDFKRLWAMIGVGAASVGLWLYHAHLAALVTISSDPISPGWLHFQGLSLVLAASRWNLLTASLSDPQLVVALVVMAGGLLLVRRDVLQVAALTVALFWLALLALGRPDNNYWGIMFAPFLGLGLPELVRRTYRHSAQTVEMDRITR